tara:strand:+ start:204 stop:776 length:573 start_codon:yes stop_codon:yes gene_type:complete
MKCKENLELHIFKHHNHLFMNNRIVNEIKDLYFTRNVRVRGGGLSNVKALQTFSTQQINSQSINLLTKWIESFLIIPPKDGRDDTKIDFHYAITDFWVAKYNKGDHTIDHSHEPAAYSFVYFVKSPTGSSPLIFTTSDTKIEPEEGTVVIFPGNLKHHVPTNNCDGRIVLAGNIYAMFYRDKSSGATFIK